MHGSRRSASTFTCCSRANRPASTTARKPREDFLVLSGECLVIIDNEERRLRTWDFVHCPPGTDHVFVGAGDGPCAILMIGARGDYGIHYPVNTRAGAHGASVTTPTDTPAEAYADWPGEFTPTQLEWPLEAPSG